jgi:periplasmic protein TonB
MGRKAMSNMVQIPTPSNYGAIEIKAWINKYTMRAFVITMIILLLLFLINFLQGAVTGGTRKVVKMAPIVKTTLTNLAEDQMSEEVAPPPPTQVIVNTGPASRAGTPIPVPDAEIAEDLKEFASMDEVARASSQGGDGIDMGEFASNIDFASDEEVEIDQIEEEPGIDDFLAVEQDPVAILSDIQKLIVYPAMAIKMGTEGKVLIRVLVGKNGKATKYKIMSSANRSLEKPAIDAVMKYTFTPAIQNKKPVACWLTIPINFRLR